MKQSGSYRSHMVTALAFAPEGDRIAVGEGFLDPRNNVESRGRLSLVDPRTGERLIQLTDRRYFIRAIAFSPDGRLLAAGLGDRSIRIWDSATFDEVAAFKGHTRIVSSLAFSPDGERLASGSADQFRKFKGGEFRLWDTATGLVLREWPQPDGVWSLAYSPDGGTIALGLDRIALASGDGGRVRTEWPLKASAKALTFLPGGALLASAAGWDVAFWDVGTGRRLARCKGHRLPVSGLAASPDGRVVASAGGDGTVRFWDAENFGERACFRWEIGAVRAVAISPDGSTVAAGGSESDILTLWDLDV